MKILAFLCLFCLVLPAQDKKNNEDTTTRSVQGIVSDSGNQQINWAVVQLKDT